MEGLTDEELMNLVRRLKEIDDFDDECESCRKPSLLHTGAYVRSEMVDDEELVGIWKEFRVRMKSVKKSIREEREQNLKEVEITKTGRLS